MEQFFSVKEVALRPLWRSRNVVNPLKFYTVYRDTLYMGSTFETDAALLKVFLEFIWPLTNHCSNCWLAFLMCRLDLRADAETRTPQPVPELDDGPSRRERRRPERHAQLELDDELQLAEQPGPALEPLVFLHQFERVLAQHPSASSTHADGESIYFSVSYLFSLGA